jgi:hypothetical protein
MKSLSPTLLAIGTAASLALAACGGGGGAAGSPVVGAGAAAVSSGTITAFGSVFVNGHEFATGSARLIDDDTGASGTDLSGLEVGMVVDVKPASASTSSSPVASELHLHPLARGVVDASDPTGSTITVMGQTVQLSATTVFSDHRACLTAASPCSAISGQTGLTATTGSGAAAVAGTYVTVHGFLFASGASASAANVVATLVSVGDAPAATTGASYKAEGVVSAVGGNGVTIGGLSVNLATATCYAAGAVAPCAGAFAAGQVVSVFSATSPALPAATFNATTARLHSTLPVEAVGSSIELEGRVSSVTTSPASFVMRGLTIDASALTSGPLPAIGDQVRVDGTVASGGATVAATSVTVLHAAASATFGFEGDVASVSAGATSQTYSISVLGQTIGVGASTRLADRSMRNGGSAQSSSNPFNIANFQTYLAASPSKHLLVRTQADGLGNLSALSVTIVPASSVAGVSGAIDAAPAPSTGASGAAPTTFSVHSVAVSAAPAAVLGPRGWGHAAATTVAAGDIVLALGTVSSATLTVSAPATATNAVIDFGAPRGRDHDCF